MPGILITGGASGIGLGVAEAAVKAGWTVHLGDRNPGTPEIGKGLGGTGTVLDVRDTGAIDSWVNTHREAEALVTSAGVCAGDYLLDSTDEQWETVMDINLMGTVRALRAWARNRRALGGGGAAVLISSNNAFWPARSVAQYCASKAAIVMLGKVAASELGDIGTRVNIIAPGETETPMTVASHRDSPDDVAEILRRTPLGRVGEPRDIGRAVCLLLSSDAGWVTGQLISVDGGISLRGEPDLTVVHQDD